MVRGRPSTVGTVLIVLTLVLAGCGGGLSLSEYSEQTERLVHTMNQGLDDAHRVLNSSAETVETIQAHLSRRAELRREFVEAFRALEPPASIADFHAFALDLTTRLAAAEAALAEKAASLETMDEMADLAQSAEVRAFEEIDAESIAMCRAAQARIDATSSAEALAGMPWIPPEMQEVVIVAFRCTAEERGLLP